MNTIIKPIITEKSIHDAGQGKFTFLVASSANKNVIRKAVEKQFGVNVISLSTIIMKGKTVRAGKRRTEKKISPAKKAIIKLKSGQKIDLFDIGS